MEDSEEVFGEEVFGLHSVSWHNSGPFTYIRVFQQGLITVAEDCIVTKRAEKQHIAALISLSRK